MWKPKSKEEREMGPELGEGVMQTVEGLVEAEKKKRTAGAVLLEILVIIIALLAGVAAAFLVARIRDVNFGFYTWPFIVCTDVFVLTTIGYFATEGGVEKVYGVCSVLSMACMIVQMAILF